jgi:hypothetical protein
MTQKPINRVIQKAIHYHNEQLETRLSFWVLPITQTIHDSNISSAAFIIGSLFMCMAEVEPSPMLLRSFIGLLYQPWTLDGDDCGAIGGMNECKRETEVLGGTCPTVTLCTTNPT